MKNDYFSVSLFAIVLMAMTGVAVPTQAACTGHSNNVDPYYTEHDNAAATELPLGYDWSIRTTVVGVEISVTFQDDFVGLTAPYMFMFDKEGNLMGGDFPMQNWNPNTRTATHTLTGYNEGDSITFLVKMAYALHVLFTERITYTVGDNCKTGDEPDEPKLPEGVCKGTSNRVDALYTNADPASTPTLQNGYDWQVETKETSVEVTVTFKDKFPGMAAPDIFLFNNDGILIGNPIPMQQFSGTTAKHVFVDYKDGDEICFLVKLAYEKHVLFTKRISYTVGSTCQEEEIDMIANTAVEDLKQKATAADKVVENGVMYILREGKRYTMTGQEIK